MCENLGRYQTLSDNVGQYGTYWDIYFQFSICWILVCIGMYLLHLFGKFALCIVLTSKMCAKSASFFQTSY